MRFSAAAATTLTSGPTPHGHPTLTAIRFTASPRLRTAPRARGAPRPVRRSSRLGGIARRAKLVAGAAQRLERQRVAELGAQPANVDVHRARAALVAAAPDPREQRLAREDPAAVGGQEREERELLRRERDPSTLDADLVRGAIDEEGADLEALLGRELAPAPLERPDARVKLGGTQGMTMKSSKPLAGSKLVICRGGRVTTVGVSLSSGTLRAARRAAAARVRPLAGLEDHRSNLAVGPRLLDDADEVVP